MCFGQIAKVRTLYKRAVTRLPVDWSSKPFCDQWLRFERECGSLDDLSHAQQRLDKRARETDAKMARAEEKIAAAEAHAQVLAEEKTQRRADKRKDQAAKKKGFASAAEANSGRNTTAPKGPTVTFGDMSLGESAKSGPSKNTNNGNGNGSNGNTGRRGLGAGRVDHTTQSTSKKNARKQPEPLINTNTNNDINGVASSTSSSSSNDNSDTRAAKRLRPEISSTPSSTTSADIGPAMPAAPELYAPGVIAGPSYGPEMPTAATPASSSSSSSGNGGKKGGKAARLEKQEAKRKQWEQQQLAALNTPHPSVDAPAPNDNNNDDDDEKNADMESETGTSARGTAGRSSSSSSYSGNEERAPRVPNAADDIRTVFVLNLGYDITEQSLANLFGSVGEVTDIRIVLGPNGKPKGFAYVQLANESLAKKAITVHNGAILDGRVISVQECKRNASKRSQVGPDPNTIFVKGVPPLVDLEQQLRTRFASCGDIAEVRLARDHQGNLKRFAYVQFKSKDGMKRALLLDGEELRDEQTGQSGVMSVQVSCPPSDDEKRKAAADRRAHAQAHERTQVKRGRSKSAMLSLQTDKPAAGGAAGTTFMPRALARTAVTTTIPTATPSVTPSGETTAASSNPAPSVGKSNADFRAMLLAGKR